MEKIKLGQKFEKEFSFSQEQVKTFAKVTGDMNPIHLDANYAAKTIYKKPIIHGYLGGSVFSEIFGNHFPGEGTVYLNQKLEFRRPMYADEIYKAVLMVKEVYPDRNRALIDTRIISIADQKPVITGEANIIHKTKI